MIWTRIHTIVLLAFAFGPFTYIAGAIFIDYIQSGGMCPQWKSQPAPCPLWERYTLLFVDLGLIDLIAGLAWATLCFIVYGLIFGMIKGYQWFIKRKTQKRASKRRYSTYGVEQSSQATSKHMQNEKTG